jgi:chemotaxis protein CheX
LDISETTASGAQAVPARIREGLVEPFIAAVSAGLGEMASTEVSAQRVYRGVIPEVVEGIGVVVALESTTEGTLMLVFPEATAVALATRILADTAQPIDELLVRDCLGEIANVVAGQAKALLAGTHYEFTYALPKVEVTPISSGKRQECVTIAFSCPQGEFALHLILQL